MKKYEVCVVGDAFIDITVPLSLKDIVYRGVNLFEIKLTCGGTANVAVWLSRFGVKSCFFGKVGNDIFGHFFKKDLLNENVTDLTVVGKNLQTGICICMVNKSGERSMLVNRGANDFLKIKDINVYFHKISKADAIYFTGYSLISKVTAKSIKYLIKKISGNRVICFNPGSYNIINDEHKEIIKNYCDILILNLEEAQILTKLKEVKSILENLEKLVEVLVLTMGGKGCIVSKEGKRIKIPALKVEKVIDTTGAGDAFSAGFLKGFVRGSKLSECAKMGHKVASTAIQRFGAR